MSSHEVISAVSIALRDILWERYADDPAIEPLFPSQSASIVFDNPTETARQGVGRLSLWLYQVAENEHLKNQPPVRLPPGPAGDAAEAMTPLATDLYYLVTPFLPSGPDSQTIVSDHLLLGLTMQALYDNSIVVLRYPARSVAEELRIVLCRLTLEELTRVWHALREPYRLSICYQVRVIQIESRRIVPGARVLERVASYSDSPVALRALGG
jgi:Pvc16 N-terminal domain